MSEANHTPDNPGANVVELTGVRARHAFALPADHANRVTQGMESLYVCIGTCVYEVKKRDLIDAVRIAHLDRLRQQQIEPT